jgi:hypothetical protein
MKLESTLPRFLPALALLVLLSGVVHGSAAPKRERPRTFDPLYGTLDEAPTAGAATLNASRAARPPGAWDGWRTMGQEITSAPAVVVSWNLRFMHVFARGVNAAGVGNRLLQRTWDDQTRRWAPEQGWNDLGGNLLSAPSCAAWSANGVSCFAVRSGDRHIWHRYWDGSSWSEQDMGGVGSSAPAVVSNGPNRLNLFVRGGDNRTMFQNFWLNGQWSNWAPMPMGGELTSAPGCVASLERGTIDCFVRGSAGLLHRVNWDGRRWSTGWEALPGNLAASSPSPTLQGSQLNVFYRGSDGMLKQKSQSLGWQDIDVPASEAILSPACVARGNGIDCFATGSYGEDPMGASQRLLYRHWSP